MEANTTAVAPSSANIVRLPTDDWFKDYEALYNPHDFHASSERLYDAAVDLREKIAREVGYTKNSSNLNEDRLECSWRADRLEALADQLRQLHRASTSQPVSL